MGWERAHAVRRLRWVDQRHLVPAFNSLTILALVVLVLGGAPWYAITAAAAFQLIPAYVTATDINTYLQILFGFAVIGVGLQARHPASVPVPLRRFLDRLGGAGPKARRRRRVRSSPSCPEPVPAAVTAGSTAGSRSSISPSGTAASWRSTA